MSTASITDIKALVTTGEASNEKLQEAIISLQELTGSATTGNNALYADLTTLHSTVDTQAGAIRDARAVADAALTSANNALAEAEAIKADYLTSEDEFIFQCGTSTDVVHKSK